MPMSLRRSCPELRIFSCFRRKKKKMNAHGLMGRMAGVHPYYILLILFTIAYTILISVFHLYDIRLIIEAMPSRPYQRFDGLGNYPVFDNDSHCMGCERLLLNGFDWKIILTIDFLIAVPSAANHFEHRRRVRNTWGGAPTSFNNKKVFFFLGKSGNASIDSEIAKENAIYGDIIQADFLDSYFNLTYKTLSILYWTHYRLSDGRFRPKWILKIDDDVFMDVFAFETYLHSYDNLKGAHLICSKREEAVPSRIDSGDGGWFVDVNTWPEPLWPPCCFGPAYVLTPLAIGRLIDAHERGDNPFLPLEDIYITGVLSRAAGVTLINYQEDVFTNYLGQEKLIVHKGLSQWSPVYIEEKWEEVQIAAFGNKTYQQMKAKVKWKEELLRQEREKKEKERRDLIAQKVAKFKKIKEEEAKAKKMVEEKAQKAKEKTEDADNAGDQVKVEPYSFQ